ncbi:hypothetical protein K4R20_11130 [Staphylococcus epidermidis]|nr:hypothetical protein [Staphylococcus epidermidis]
MKAPYEIQKELENRIIKKDYTFESYTKLKGETITHFFTGTHDEIGYVGLPIIILVTNTNKIIVLEHQVDEVEKYELEAPEIACLKQTNMSEDKFLNHWLHSKVKINGFFRDQQLPFVDYDAVKQYKNFINNEKKKLEDKYQKEQEYKKFLELKQKFEEDDNND